VFWTLYSLVMMHFRHLVKTFTPKRAVITRNSTVRCEAEDTVETAGIKTLTLNNEKSNDKTDLSYKNRRTQRILQIQ
jgi:hypothetical protein